MMNRDELLKQTLDTHRLDWENFKGYAKCVKVYDGDTITVVMPRFDDYWLVNLRMLHVDTPEMKPHGRNLVGALREKSVATEAGNVLRERILNKIIYVECKSNDKYGRTLAEIYSEEKKERMDKLLISDGLCLSYEGGTKQNITTLVDKYIDLHPDVLERGLDKHMKSYLDKSFKKDKFDDDLLDLISQFPSLLKSHPKLVKEFPDKFK